MIGLFVKSGKKENQMIKYDTDCVDCAMDCIGEMCPYYSVPIYICDECAEELYPEQLYIYEEYGLEKMLCKSCLLKKFITVDKWETLQ